MKTPLTFLLSLTFLFLFSGSVYGGVIDETIDGVFDRKGGSVVVNCKLSEKRYLYIYYVISTKDKVIKRTSNINVHQRKYTIFDIVKEDELFIKGKRKSPSETVTESFILITRHEYENKIFIEERWKGFGKENAKTYKCSIGNKVF